MKTLSELLTPEERAAIRAPIEKTGILPRRAFGDEDFHAFREERVRAITNLRIATNGVRHALGPVEARRSA